MEHAMSDDPAYFDTLYRRHGDENATASAFPDYPEYKTEPDYTTGPDYN